MIFLQCPSWSFPCPMTLSYILFYAFLRFFFHKDQSICPPFTSSLLHFEWPPRRSIIHMTVQVIFCNRKQFKWFQPGFSVYIFTFPSSKIRKSHQSDYSFTFSMLATTNADSDVLARHKSDSNFTSITCSLHRLLNKIKGFCSPSFWTTGKHYKHFKMDDKVCPTRTVPISTILHLKPAKAPVFWSHTLPKGWPLYPPGPPKLSLSCSLNEQGPILSQQSAFQVLPEFYFTQPSTV